MLWWNKKNKNRWLRILGYKQTCFSCGHTFYTLEDKHKEQKCPNCESIIYPGITPSIEWIGTTQ